MEEPRFTCHARLDPLHDYVCIVLKGSMDNQRSLDWVELNRVISNQVSQGQIRFVFQLSELRHLSEHAAISLITLRHELSRLDPQGIVILQGLGEWTHAAIYRKTDHEPALVFMLSVNDQETRRIMAEHWWEIRGRPSHQ